LKSDVRYLSFSNRNGNTSDGLGRPVSVEITNAGLYAVDLGHISSMKGDSWT